MAIDKKDLGTGGENFVFMREHYKTDFFQNGMVKTFAERCCVEAEICATTADTHFVVIINHLDRTFFISRTKDLRAYLRGVASFLVGSEYYYASADLARARTEKNLRHWCAEVLDASKVTVAHIRDTLQGWTELGSKTHISRLGGGDVVFYKLTNLRTGWSRFGSHKAEKKPHFAYIATQALHGILSRLRRDRLIPMNEKIALDREYTRIYYEFEKNPESFKVEVVEQVDKDKVNYRPIDVVREKNAVLEAEWLSSEFVKTLLGK